MWQEGLVASLLRAGVSLALGSGTEGGGVGGVFRRGPEGWEQGLKMANGVGGYAGPPA